MTSIFGVTLSIIFGVIYRSKLSKSMSALDNYIVCYHDMVLPKTEHKVVETLMEYQEEQKDSINELAESIAIELEKSLPSAISEATDKIMTPHLQNFGDILNKFVDNTSQGQLEGLDTVVTSFVTSMNDALGGQFEKFGESMAKFCDLQDTSLKEMQHIVTEICDSAELMDTVNKNTRETISTFDKYIDNIATKQTEATSKLNSVADKLNDLRQIINENVKALQEATYTENNTTNELQKSLLDMQELYRSLTENTEKWTKSTKEILEEFALQRNASEELTAGTAEQISHVISLLDNVRLQMSSDVDKICKDLKSASTLYGEEIEGSLNVTFEIFDKSMANITKHLSGTVSEIENITERVPVVLDSVCTQMNDELNSYLHSIINVHNQFNEELKILETDMEYVKKRGDE